MSNDDYKAAEKVARQNLNKIVNRMPRRLAQQEENIFENLKRSGEPYFRKLERLYVLMDDLYSFFGKYTPC